MACVGRVAWRRGPGHTALWLLHGAAAGSTSPPASSGRGSLNKCLVHRHSTRSIFRLPSVRGDTTAFFLVCVFVCCIIPHSLFSVVLGTLWAPFWFLLGYFWRPRVALGAPGVHNRRRSRIKREKYSPRGTNGSPNGHPLGTIFCIIPEKNAFVVPLLVALGHHFRRLGTGTSIFSKSIVLLK